MNATFHYKQKSLATQAETVLGESALLKRLLLRASRLGARLFRNQVGVYRLARPECRECQSRGRIISSGFCPGSSDLVGWLPLTVTPDMVGQRLAVFVAVEAKTASGRVSPAQVAFLRAVNDAGGRGHVVRGVDELVELFKVF